MLSFVIITNTLFLERYLKSFFVGISLLLFRLFKFQTGYIAEQEQNNGKKVVLNSLSDLVNFMFSYKQEMLIQNCEFFCFRK